MRDMQFLMAQLYACIKKGKLSQTAALAAQMAREIKSELDEPTTVLPLGKQAALKSLYTQVQFLSGVAAEKEAQRVAYAYNVVQDTFNALFANTIVYLLRHPEKTSEKGRNITAEGVRYSRYYALNLINEIKLCPKNVNVFMYVSEVTRTQSFANVVAYELKKLAELEGRTVGIAQNGFDKRLSFRFTKEELAFTESQAKARGVQGESGGWEQFLDWVQNYKRDSREFPALHDPQQISAELLDFVASKRQEHSTTSQTLSIVLGFSHSWILDALRLQIAGSSVKSIITSAGQKGAQAGFLKADGDQISVDNQWYPYKP